MRSKNLQRRVLIEVCLYKYFDLKILHLVHINREYNIIYFEYKQIQDTCNDFILQYIFQYFALHGVIYNLIKVICYKYNKD